MNIALIFAGGTGQRMNTKTMPKQFLELHGKPIIIYTLEYFEKHQDIDEIVVVCLEGWIEYLNKLLEKFFISKVKTIVPGGSTGQESIKNGVYKINELYSKIDNTIVLVHDGVRPLIDKEIITKNIQCVKDNGSAITVAPAIETIITKKEEKVASILERSICQMARAPQSFYLKDLYKAHVEATRKGINTYIDSACLMKDYGIELYTIEGGSENIKITTPSDFYIFRAIIDARENAQIFG